jgi:hypothetical protein
MTTTLRTALIALLVAIWAAITLLLGSGVALAAPLGYDDSKGIGYGTANGDIFEIFFHNGAVLTLSDQKGRGGFCASELANAQSFLAQHNITLDTAGYLAGCYQAAIDAVQRGQAK